jgi:hypothetical protein
MSDVEQRYLDKRTIERYVRSGRLDEKNYEKLLKALPDLAEKAENISTRMDDEDFDTDGDGDAGVETATAPT